MEAPGITSTSGAAMSSSNPVGKHVAEEPDQLATPDVVSALDPAYSMHPILKALMQGGGSTGSAMQMPHSWGSPWQQMGPEFWGKNQKAASILSGLGYPGLGLDFGIKTQGEAL
jgi:hypothetical protein